MIGIGKINDDIARAEGDAYDFMGAGKIGSLNKTKKKIEFLRLCKAYLETNPSEAFLKDDEERLRNRITLLMKGYDDWLKNGEQKPKKKPNELKTMYEKHVGLPELRVQLNTLKYLLYGES